MDYLGEAFDNVYKFHAYKRDYSKFPNLKALPVTHTYIGQIVEISWILFFVYWYFNAIFDFLASGNLGCNAWFFAEKGELWDSILSACLGGQCPLNVLEGAFCCSGAWRESQSKSNPQYMRLGRSAPAQICFCHSKEDFCLKVFLHRSPLWGNLGSFPVHVISWAWIVASQLKRQEEITKAFKSHCGFTVLAVSKFVVCTVKWIDFVV